MKKKENKGNLRSLKARQAYKLKIRSLLVNVRSGPVLDFAPFPGIEIIVSPKSIPYH